MTTRRESLETLAQMGLRIGLRAGVAGGLLAGLGGCGTLARAIREEASGMATPGPTDRQRALIAWQYFTSGARAGTGLVEVVAGAGFATCASVADQIAALVCGYRLGVVSRVEFDAGISALLGFLSHAPLAGGALPGRFYSTASGQLRDPPAQEGDPGWSGVQVGRLLLWLGVLARRFEAYRVAIAGIVARWRICDALDADGRICEGLPAGMQGFVRRVERGSAYTAIAAQGYRAWGLSPSPSFALTSDFAVSVEGLDFAIGEEGAARPALQVVPLALLGLELGWKGLGGSDLAPHKALLARVFEAQERRRVRTAILTARGDFRRTAAPYTVTSAVVAGGTPWGTVDDEGKAWPELALVSTRAAFAMWALGAPSGGEALRRVDTLHAPGAGWFEGRYEATSVQETTRTAATNAFVLEALLFRELGAVAQGAGPEALIPGEAAALPCPAVP